MKTDFVVGIDTSNYTTSVAVATVDGEVVYNGKAPLPVKEGECGLRQSDALFAHTKNLPELFATLRDVLHGKNPCAVGVSEKPRNQENSYMPCFLAGISAASAIAASCGVPLYRFSHQCGHLRAAIYSAGMPVPEEGSEPFGAFHISGGTTEMLRVRKDGCGFKAEIVGGSLDLHAGQAIDRIGVMLGLRFPCGPELEKLASRNNEQFAARGTHTEDGFIHLSGLQNLAQKMWQNGAKAETVAAFTLDYLSRAVIAMSRCYRERYGDTPLLYAGGVMSNAWIRERIRKEIRNTYFAEPMFSADNAAGISLLTADIIRSKFR